MAMNYFLMPSLKCRALIKTVTNLWNQDDVWVLILEFALPILEKEAKLYKSVYSSDRVASIVKTAEDRIRQDRRWLWVENVIIAEVETLPLPKSLHKELMNFVKPIGLEILGWKVYHYFACDIDFDVAYGICWTQHGTVDQKKTAERLIVDDRFDISTRYRLACVCCLESDARALWDRLSGHDKEHSPSFSERKYSKQHVLVRYWSCVIKGEIYQFKWRFGIEFSLDLHLLKMSAEEGNKAATEYFFKKLSPEYKKDCFSDVASKALLFCDWTQYIYSADILCFLLSRMEEEKRMHLFEQYAEKILLSFVSWPYQGFFMEATKHAWEFLDEVGFMRLLHTILLKVTHGYKDYDYHKLFANLWLQSPISKVRMCCDSTLILSLFDVGDKGNIRLILKDATLVNKKFLFSPGGKSICFYLTVGGKWDSLHFLLGECISSKELAVMLREEWKRCGTAHLSQLFETDGAKEKFLQELDNFSHMFDKKRCTEESDGPVAKRLAYNLRNKQTEEESLKQISLSILFIPED